MTIAQRVLAALRHHGPMTCREIAALEEFSDVLIGTLRNAIYRLSCDDAIKSMIKQRRIQAGRPEYVYSAPREINERQA